MSDMMFMSLVIVERLINYQPFTLPYLLHFTFEQGNLMSPSNNTKVLLPARV
jgi:hypothetical protein